jgi:two-component system sensor kinase
MDEGFCVAEMIYDSNGKAVDYRFIEVNPMFEKHTGLIEAKGKTIREMVPNHDAHWFEIYGNVARTGEAIRFENSADAMHRYYDVFAYRIGEDGSPNVGILFKDITEEKKYEEALQKLNLSLETSNKELEAFSYSVSHDLRGPLRAIDGFSRILLQDYMNTLDNEGKRLLNIVSNNTRKMGQLIDDILSFSRVGRKEIGLSEINMGKLVKDVLGELNPDTDGRKIKINIKPLPNAHADVSMIRQVLVNLLSNAIKFTVPRADALIEVGSDTHISSDKKGFSENIYYVKDNGVGFDMNYAHKLFGVFQRLHGVDEFEGTGIGLAIVKRVIDKHGGHVWAEGKVNEGAIFSFTLPGVL